MKLIIDIDEQEYETILANAKLYKDNSWGSADVWDAILNGILYEQRPQDKWIPVNEKSPDDMQKVLIWFEYYRYGDFNCMYQTYGFGYVCDGKWSPFINGKTGWQDYNIIAWQPLPEPYKKGDAE